jgi:hypothetical protein
MIDGPTNSNVGEITSRHGLGIVSASMPRFAYPNAYFGLFLPRKAYASTRNANADKA